MVVKMMFAQLTEHGRREAVAIRRKAMRRLRRQCGPEVQFQDSAHGAGRYTLQAHVGGTVVEDVVITGS